MLIDFRDAYCNWIVPEHEPGTPRKPDELHVAPKNDVIRRKLRDALGGQVMNSRDKAKYPRRYNVLREVDGVFVLVTDGYKRWK